VDARGGHAEHFPCLTNRQPCDPLKVTLADSLALPTELLTLPTRAGKTGVDALPNPFTFAMSPTTSNILRSIAAS